MEITYKTDISLATVTKKNNFLMRKIILDLAVTLDGFIERS